MEIPFPLPDRRPVPEKVTDGDENRTEDDPEDLADLVVNFVGQETPSLRTEVLRDWYLKLSHRELLAVERTLGAVEAGMPPVTLPMPELGDKAVFLSAGTTRLRNQIETVKSLDLRGRRWKRHKGLSTGEEIQRSVEDTTRKDVRRLSPEKFPTVGKKQEARLQALRATRAGALDAEGRERLLKEYYCQRADLLYHEVAKAEEQEQVQQLRGRKLDKALKGLEVRTRKTGDRQKSRETESARKSPLGSRERRRKNPSPRRRRIPSPSPPRRRESSQEDSASGDDPTETEIPDPVVVPLARNLTASETDQDLREELARARKERDAALEEVKRIAWPPAVLSSWRRDREVRRELTRRQLQRADAQKQLEGKLKGLEIRKTVSPKAGAKGEKSQGRGPPAKRSSTPATKEPEVQEVDSGLGPTLRRYRIPRKASGEKREVGVDRVPSEKRKSAPSNPETPQDKIEDKKIRTDPKDPRTDRKDYCKKAEIDLLVPEWGKLRPDGKRKELAPASSSDSESGSPRRRSLDPKEGEEEETHTVGESWDSRDSEGPEPSEDAEAIQMAVSPQTVKGLE